MEEPPSRNERSALTDRTAPKAGTSGSQQERTGLRTRTAQMERKGPAFSGWALSGATRRAEQKWMLFERSEFHPFPARSKAE